MQTKPTILIGIGDIGCTLVNLYMTNIKERKPESLQIIRALGINIKPKENLMNLNFHMENVGGFVPSDMMAKLNSIDNKHMLWFIKNVSADRITMMHETLQSDPLIRPIGRLAFFLKNSKIHKLLEKYLHEIRLIWKQRSEQINIFIISPLFDGLGSGIVADLAYISRSASTSEKVKTNIIGIFISELFGGQEKNNLTTRMYEANLYASLREISYFQRSSSFRPLSGKYFRFDTKDKMFNICYIVNSGIGSLLGDRDGALTRLTSILEILSMSPYDSSRRLLIDQLNTQEENYAGVGLSILKYDRGKVKSILARKLVSELLRGILNGQFERQVEAQLSSVEVDKYDGESVNDDFKKEIAKKELFHLWPLKWKQVKDIVDNEKLNELMQNILKDRLKKVRQFLDQYFLNLKNDIKSKITSSYQDIINKRRNGLLYAKKFLDEFSLKVKSLSKEVTKTKQSMASSMDEAETNLRQLLDRVEKLTNVSPLEKISGIFNRQQIKKQRKLADDFFSLLSVFAKKSIKNLLWDALIHFYSEVDDFLKNESKKVESRTSSLDKLYEKIGRDIEETAKLIFNSDGISRFFLEDEDLERIYEIYKPDLEDMMTAFYQQHDNFYTLIENCSLLEEQLIEFCSAYYIAYSEMDISDIFKTEGLLKLEDILNRLYLFSQPKAVPEVKIGEKFYERVVVHSNIDELLFRDVREKVDFDFELICENINIDLLMLRECYGIKLSRLEEIKKIEQAYLDLRKEDFPLHTLSERYELPYISYSPQFIKERKRSFAVAQFMKFITIEEGGFFWHDSNGSIRSLGKEKDIAFFNFIRNDEMPEDIEQRFCQMVQDEGIDKMKILLKAFIKNMEASGDLSKEELNILGEHYNQLGLK